MADPNEGGLITLKCIKNRFGETHPITIRPNFETAAFDVTDSPQFTKRTAETQKLLDIITENPGLTQNAWWKKCGMMKSRFIALVKENAVTLWREEKDGSSLRYASLVLKTQNNQENNRTGQGLGGCSPVLSLYRENREQPPLDPRGCSRPEGTDRQKTNGKVVLPSCPVCGSFAVYMEPSGNAICQTCEAGST